MGITDQCSGLQHKQAVIKIIHSAT